MCSNCEKAITDGTYIALTKGSKVIATLCTACQEGVLVGKIVFKRMDPKDDFTFEQYLPVACVK